MTLYNLNHTGRQIFLYDDAQKTLVAKTTVLAHDKTRNVVTVSSSVLRFSVCDQLSLLILWENGEENGVYECKGRILPENNFLTREIALFQGRSKNDRSATRYTLNARGHVQSLLIARQVVALRQPLEVCVVNLSSSGVLLRAETKLLNVGTGFQLTLHLSEEDALLGASVARLNRLDTGETEYGCKF